MDTTTPHTLTFSGDTFLDIRGNYNHSYINNTAHDDLYRRILDENMKEHSAELLHILTVLSGSRDRRSLNFSDIERLLQLPQGRVAEVMKGMSPVLDLDHIPLLDPKFEDFLHDKVRSRDFFIDSRDVPAVITKMHFESVPRYAFATQARISIGLVRFIDMLSALFKNKDGYKRLLAFRGPNAQKLLDSFQTLLDTPRLDDSFKRHLVTAVQRLSDRSGLYPICFNIDNIQLVGEYPVAHGGSADIYKGVFNIQSVCLKVVRFYEPTQVEYFMKRLTKEAILWRQLSHPNLLPFYGSYRFRSRPCLVSPWLEYGDVTQYLRNHPDSNRILLAKDISAGVLYLHTLDIIHGDLKGVNILVTDNRRACLADFGLSSVTDAQILNWTSHSSIGSKGGTVRWQAPELYNFEEDDISLIHNSKASDIYSLSCVFYELLTGSVPFSKIMREPAVISKVQSGGRPAKPADSHISWGSWGLTTEIWSLMESCWRTDPAARPSINDVVNRLDQTFTEDNRPTEPDGANLAAQFYTSVGVYPVPLDVNQLEAMVFGSGNVQLASAQN